MDAELCMRAAEKIGNPNILVNLVSRRVKQLNSGGGGLSRPLVEWKPDMGAADVALTEIVEDKITYELESEAEEKAPPARSRKSRRVREL
ncbi:MAG: DNA-directed RNA polymerase subunit omega [Verrucomicrobia bacterium]|nr:MAG: DNA-directed RNA polymerase subunit omega [Verrucomicrobiota bacterium]